MDDIKKASPPPLPKDAFKQPGHEIASPWDTISSAPTPQAKPAAKQGLVMPEWLGRPIGHSDHAQQLELDSALNEFGSKMPRQQAEDEAYKQYLFHPTKGQHALAAAHHLAGMKAAHGAGDMEAARKHSLMYGLHTKALGTDDSGVPPKGVQQILNSAPPKVYKFKAHRGDAFAVDQPMAPRDNGVISSTGAPQLSKSQEEQLCKIYDMAVQALAKAEKAGVKPKEHKGHCHCSAYKFCHRWSGGKCMVVKPA